MTNGQYLERMVYTSSSAVTLVSEGSYQDNDEGAYTMYVSTPPATAPTQASGGVAESDSTEDVDSDAVDLFESISDEEDAEDSDLRRQRPNPLLEEEEDADQALAEFEAGNIDDQQLETELLSFVFSLHKQGIETDASVRNGQLTFSRPQASLPSSISYIGGAEGDVSNQSVTFRFQSLTTEDQLVMVRDMMSSAHESAPPIFNPYSSEQIDLATNIIADGDDANVAALSRQTARVQQLAGSELDTPAQQQRLRRETAMLARLSQQAGINSDRFSYDPASDDVVIRYSQDNPPSLGLGATTFESDAEGDPYWSARIGLSNHDSHGQRQIASQMVSELVDRGAKHSLNHTDVFGEHAAQPSDRMLALHADLDRAQSVDESVDLDRMYRMSVIGAQVSFNEENLRGVEYHSSEAAIAMLGDQAWGLSADELFEMYDWIEGDGLEQPRLIEGDGDDPGMSERERQFLASWANTSRAARLDYLGIDAQRWHKAAPHIDLAMQANEAIKDSRFGLDDLVKAGIGIIVTKLTAGALGSTFSGWLGSAGMSKAAAGLVGTSLGTAAGSMLATWIQTGEWTAARDVFKDMISGDLKDGLLKVALQNFGINAELADLVDAKKREKLVEAFGMDMLREISPGVIDALKAIAPDVVDQYLSELNKVLKTTDDPDVLADFTGSWWGIQLSALLGVDSEEGTALVSKLLSGALSEGELDIDALRGFMNEEIADQLASLPAELVERLGGKDNTLAVLAGMASRYVIENDFDLDKARQELEDFVEDMAEPWIGDVLKDAVQWVPGSRSWSGDFSRLINHARSNNWDAGAIDEYLDDNALMQKVVNSYVPDGVARGMLSRAYQFADEIGFDRNRLTKLISDDLMEMISDAGISSDIVGLMGGEDKVIASMTRVFGERFVANDADIAATLAQMRAYTQSFAAGYVGEFAGAVLNPVPVAGFASTDTAPMTNELGLHGVAQSAQQVLAEQIPIPGLPFVTFATEGLTGPDEQIESMQSAIDYLNCKGKAEMEFTSAERTFMREFFQSVSVGGYVLGQPEGASLVGHYVDGSGTPVVVSPDPYQSSVIVRDTTEAMQLHIRDLAEAGQSFASVSSTDESFRQSTHFQNVVSIDGSRDDYSQGYVDSDGTLVAEKSNELLRNHHHTFEILSASAQTRSGEFQTTFTVTSHYQFESYAEGDKHTELWLNSESQPIRLPDGLSEYMDSRLNMARSFDCHSDWSVLWV